MALVISLTLDAVSVVIDMRVAPSSRIGRLLEESNAPEEALVNWLVPGHTLVQPLADMVFSIIIDWALVFIVLSLITLGLKSLKKAWRR